MKKKLAVKARRLIDHIYWFLFAYPVIETMLWYLSSVPTFLMYVLFVYSTDMTNSTSTTIILAISLWAFVTVMKIFVVSPWRAPRSDSMLLNKVYWDGFARSYKYRQSCIPRLARRILARTPAHRAWINGLNKGRRYRSFALHASCACS